MSTALKRITILTGLAIALISCTPKDSYITGDTLSMRLRATFEAEETKTVLVDNGDATYQMNWTSSDEIVVNGKTSNSIEVDASDARIAVFDLPVVDAPYSAISPASVYSGGYTASTSESPASMKVTLPAVQNYVSGGYDPAAAVTLGRGDASLLFSHAMAYLRITVSGTADTDAIKSIRVQANNGQAMSGSFTASFADVPALENGKDSYSSVTLDCGSGVAQGTAMFIAIPAATYSSGINLLITDASDHFMTVRSTASFSALAGKVYRTTVSFNPSADAPVDGGIYTVADWAAFAESVSNGYDYEGKTVTIMSDLDVDDYFAYANGTFNGVLEGNNHTLKANGNMWPLFNIIGNNGVVRNLTIDGSFSGMANSGGAGNATIAKRNLGLIENCINRASTDITVTTSCIFGTICAENGGEIKDCKNYGNVTIHHNATSTVGLFGGGIAALGHTILGGSSATHIDTDGSCSPGKFTNCENHGDIYIEVMGSFVVKSSVGGICGQVYLDGVEFSGCKNYGNVTRISNGETTSNRSNTIGGILGRSCAWYTTSPGDSGALGLDKGYNTKFTDCRNEGTIKTFCRHSGGVTNNVSGARLDAAGGIVGAVAGISGSAATISGCTNTGTILGGWNSSVNTSALGGLAGLAKFVDISSGSSICALQSVDKTAVGAAGGLVAFALSEVNVTDCIAVPAIDVVCKASSTCLPGLLIGNVVTSATFSSCQVAGSIKVDGSDLGVNSGNFKDYAVAKSPTASKVKPDVTTVTWYE